MILSILFGVSGSVCSLFIRYGRRLLLHVLRNDQHARIRMPTNEEVTDFQSVICAKYSSLQNVYAVADGLKLYLEQAGDGVIQNMFYNGWKHDHFVSNVFVFAPSGVIIACAVNAPGAIHDSQVAELGGIYRKLRHVFDHCGATCVVDSAFSRGNHPFLLKSSQDHLVITNDFSRIIQLKQATSLRQSSEWGVRALQGTFPRMKDRFSYEERGERKIMLTLTVLLFNLRTRLVGMNQILSTFMPHLNVEANHMILEFH